MRSGLLKKSNHLRPIYLRCLTVMKDDGGWHPLGSIELSLFCEHQSYLESETISLVTKSPWVMEIDTKSSYTKSGGRLLKADFLACPIRMGGPSLLICIGQSKIQDNGSHAHTLFSILRFSPSFRGAKKRCQKFHPTFKTRPYTQRANKLLIESILKERLNPRFHPSLILFEELSG